MPNDNIVNEARVAPPVDISNLEKKIFRWQLGQLIVSIIFAGTLIGVTVGVKTLATKQWGLIIGGSGAVLLLFGNFCVYRHTKSLKRAKSAAEAAQCQEQQRKQQEIAQQQQTDARQKAEQRESQIEKEREAKKKREAEEQEERDRQHEQNDKNLTKAEGILGKLVESQAQCKRESEELEKQKAEEQEKVHAEEQQAEMNRKHQVEERQKKATLAYQNEQQLKQQQKAALHAEVSEKRIQHSEQNEKQRETQRLAEAQQKTEESQKRNIAQQQQEQARAEAIAELGIKAEQKEKQRAAEQAAQERAQAEQTQKAQVQAQKLVQQQNQVAAPEIVRSQHVATDPRPLCFCLEDGDLCATAEIVKKHGIRNDRVADHMNKFFHPDMDIQPMQAAASAKVNFMTQENQPPQLKLTSFVENTTGSLIYFATWGGKKVVIKGMGEDEADRFRAVQGSKHVVQILGTMKYVEFKPALDAFNPRFINASGREINKWSKQTFIIMEALEATDKVLHLETCKNNFTQDWGCREDKPIDPITLPPITPRVIDVMIQAAEAILMIHQKQLVHYDIKTENFGFDEHGILKFFDFGNSEPKNKQKEADDVIALSKLFVNLIAGKDLLRSNEYNRTRIPPVHGDFEELLSQYILIQETPIKELIMNMMNPNLPKENILPDVIRVLKNFRQSC